VQPPGHEATIPPSATARPSPFPAKAPRCWRKIPIALRAKFRTLREENGFPQILTEAWLHLIFRLQGHFPDTVMYLDSTGLAALSIDQGVNQGEKDCRSEGTIAYHG